MSIPLRRSPDLERVVMAKTESFHWNAHDFPSDLAHWNYHPECEIHLIRRSHGTAFVGDHIGPFEEGNLVLVGPNLPHHWESDRGPGQVVPLRDVALHFDPGLIHRAAQVMPELLEIESLLKDAGRGLVFHGGTARLGAELLERIGLETGVKRLLHFGDLLHVLARSLEREALASVGYLPSLDRDAPPVVQKIMHYILGNLSEDLSTREAARLTGMTHTAFCRFFKRNTGNSFGAYVRKLRVGAACKRLVSSKDPITEICFEVGFRNVSNFNRLFRQEKGLTPSQYRHMSAFGGAAGEVKDELPKGARGNRPPVGRRPLAR